MNELKTKIPRSLKNNLIIATYSIILFLLLTNIIGLYEGFSVIFSYIAPFFVAIGLAFIFNLPMKAIEEKILCKLELKHKAKRAMSLTMTYVMFIMLIAGLVMFIYPQIKESILTLSSSIQGYVVNFEAFLNDFLSKYEIPAEFIAILDTQFEKIISFMTTMLANFVPYTLNLSVQIVSSAFNLILSFIMSIYMLSSKEQLIMSIKKMNYAFFREKTADYLVKVANLANKTFSGFIAGQLTEAVILGSLCTIGMLILNLEYALLIGTIMGMMAVIPIFGAFIGTATGIVILIMINPMKALIFLIFTTILQQIENNLIYPRVVGNSIGISGLWIIFALLLGGGIYGVQGILIGIPLFAVTYILLREWTNNKLLEKNIDISVKIQEKVEENTEKTKEETTEEENQ